MYQDLQEHLKNRLSLLCGAWVKEKRSSYEGELCKLLEFTVKKNRYWDAEWRNYRIELKKGAIWLDLVRYGEMLLKINEQAKAETISLFLFPNKNKDSVSGIACVETSKIIDKLGLDGDTAHFLIELSKRLPRQLNAQASLTANDIKKIAAFIVPEVVNLDDLL